MKAFNQITVDNVVNDILDTTCGENTEIVIKDKYLKNIASGIWNDDDIIEWYEHLVEAFQYDVLENVVKIKLYNVVKMETVDDGSAY